MVTQKHYVNKEKLANTETLVDYLSHSAARLLDIHAMLLKAKKNNIGGKADLLNQIDSTKKQLDEISYALILEYRKRQENERFLKQILISVSDQLLSLNNNFKETGRLFFQEIRILQSQMQCFYEGSEKKFTSMDKEVSYTPSKIDEIITQLKKTREKLAFESPHLFKK